MSHSISKEKAQELGITAIQFDTICNSLGRTINATEGQLIALILSDEQLRKGFESIAHHDNQTPLKKEKHCAIKSFRHANTDEYHRQTPSIIAENSVCDITTLSLTNHLISGVLTPSLSPSKNVIVRKDGQTIGELELNHFIESAAHTHDNEEQTDPVSGEHLTEPSDLKKVALELLCNAHLRMQRSEKRSLATSNSDSDAPIYSHGEENLALAIEGSPFLSTHGYSLLRSLSNATSRLVCSGASLTGFVIYAHLNLHHAAFQAHLQGFVSAINQLHSHLETSISWSVVVETDERLSMDQPLVFVGATGENFSYKTGAFQSKGDLIFLLGENVEDAGEGIYVNTYHKQPSKESYLNFKQTIRTQSAVLQLNHKSYINASKTCQAGGLFAALIAMAVTNELGFDIVTDAEIREDLFLFGETPGRIIVTVNEDHEDNFLEYMMKSKVNFTLLGHVTQGKMVIDDEHYGFSKEVKKLLDSPV